MLRAFEDEIEACISEGLSIAPKLKNDDALRPGARIAYSLENENDNTRACLAKTMVSQRKKYVIRNPSHHHHHHLMKK